MNSPFVAIVPLYTLAVRRTVRWRRYRFAILQGWSVYYHTYVTVYVVTHNGMDPGAAIVTRPSQKRQVFDHSPYTDTSDADVTDTYSTIMYWSLFRTFILGFDLVVNI